MHVHTEGPGCWGQSPGDTHVDRQVEEGLYRPGCLGRGPWVYSCRGEGPSPAGQRTTADEAAVSRDSLLPFPGATPALSPGCQLSPLQARLEGRAGRRPAWQPGTHAGPTALNPGICWASLMNSSGAPRFPIQTGHGTMETSPDPRQDH